MIAGEQDQPVVYAAQVQESAGRIAEDATRLW